MTTIIAGGFQVHDAAEAAIGRLLEAGIPDDNLCSFRVNPPGEHSQLAIGGDRHESPGATKAGGGAAVGAAVGAAAGAAAGMAASPVLGPVAIAGGAGVGAYTGALVGALGAMDKRTHREEMRPAETLVAVNLDGASLDEQRVVDILEQCGAEQIERAEGTWSGGEWSDFDPVSRPNLLRPQAGRDRRSANP
jgi:hypothetical protein